MHRLYGVDRDSEGFTLIEALVALAIVAIVLSSVGLVVANAVKGTRTLEGRVGRLAAAKTMLSALPERNALVPGSVSGRLEGNDWRIDVSLYANSDERGPNVQWVPQLVVLAVRNPNSGDMTIETVRLGRRDAK